MTYFIGSQKYDLDAGWGRLPEGYEFHQVAGVAVDGSDNVYLFNRSSHQLMVFDGDGNFLKAWAQTFSHPHGMHVDTEGNVYLADQMAHAVLKYSPEESLLLTLGTTDRPSDTGWSPEDRSVKRAARPFNQPTGIAVSTGGDIFVSDGYGNSRVHKFDGAGSLLLSWGSPGTTGDGEFHLPHGIVLDGQGRVLVCDRENHRIQVFTQGGENLETWTGFRQPTALAVGPDGHVYVSELQHRVTVLDSEGNVLARWGGESSREPGRFVAPHGIAVDSRGSVYVGEVLEGKRVQKFVRR